MFRVLARPLIASWFIYDGVQTALEPAERAARVAPLLEPGTEATGVEVDAQTVVRAHAIAQVAAAAVLATSKTPRTAGTVLALVAGAGLAAQPQFWRMPEGDARDAATADFIKNAALLGAAMLAGSAGHGELHKKRRSRKKARAKERKAQVRAREEAAIAKALQKAERRFW